MTNEETAKALEDEAETCGRPYKAADLRHLAAELRAQSDTRHACGNCEGVQPDTCAAHVEKGAF